MPVVGNPMHGASANVHGDIRHIHKIHLGEVAAHYHILIFPPNHAHIPKNIALRHDFTKNCIKKIKKYGFFAIFAIITLF